MDQPHHRNEFARLDRVKFKAHLTAVAAMCLLLAACRADSASNSATTQESAADTFAGQLQGGTASGDKRLLAQHTGKVQALNAVQSDISIVYPTNNLLIPAASTFIVGSCPPGRQLQCNGSDVRINAKGYFAHVVQLKPGSNTFTVTETGAPGQQQEVTVRREMPPPAISTEQFKLAIETAQPHDDRGVAPGDFIPLSVHATPGGDVKVLIGKKTIQLRPAAAVQAEVRSAKRKKKAAKAKGRLAVNVNLGMDAAYGQAFQRSPGSAPDIYMGFYKVEPDDRWQNIAPKFILSKNGRTTGAPGPGRISTVLQPTLAQTRHDDTVVRLGPGASRTTPISAGVRVLVDGWQGEQLRCLYSTAHHVWIAKDDLAFESDSAESGPLPQTTIRTINLLNDDYGADIVLPLTQRLPYQIEQHMKPNRLTMRIYGATADTDWVTPLVPGPKQHDLIERVAWKQQADGIYEMTVYLKQARQWGFKADYQGSNLHLHVKSPPALSPTEGKRLNGLVICLDPGHGGAESGALGCGGKREADFNLGIALKLRDLLAKEGAKVIMTRSGDTDVSLEQRVQIANENNVDILLSIHNNALPDGRDPWTEHGTSSYWYHPQSAEFAHKLKEGVQKEIAFGDLATRWQNLALIRPSGELAVLAEIGFMVNPDEYAYLEQNAGQEKSAQGLLDGLVQFLSAN
jgi:N-acetylmuramoyl-L-alanine amidase